MLIIWFDHMCHGGKSKYVDLAIGKSKFDLAMEKVQLDVGNWRSPSMDAWHGKSNMVLARKVQVATWKRKV